MDVFGIGFLIVVSVVGGLIAVFADNLGRTLGKKRLSFMKMRPRRTAQVFTFAAGALIPLLTVGSVLWLSQDVRRWFAEGPGVIAERDRLLGDVKGLESKEEKLSAQIANLDKEIQSRQKLLEDLRGQLAASEAKLSAAQARVAQLDQRTRSLAAESKRLAAQVQQKSKEYSALDTRFRKREAEFSDLNARYRQLDQSFDILSVDIEDAYKENRRLNEENEDLSQKVKDSTQTIADLEKRIKELGTQAEDKTRELQGLIAAKQRELELASIELDKRNGELKFAEQQLAQIGAIALDARRLPLMFHVGQEVSRIQVGTNLSPGGATEGLTRLIRTARSEAESRGAKPKGAFPSAGIMERLDPEAGRMLSPEEQLQRMVNRITGLSEPLVLVATSSVNSFLGEPVSLDIQYFRNPVVFEEGDLVAEARIDGDRPEEVLIDQISDFVRNVVRDAAKQGGMVPILGMEQGYGEMPQNTLLALMRTARANNRRVRIQAVAPKDIRAGDPLILDYRIR